MKIRVLALVTLTVACPVSANVPVIDTSNLEQAIEQVRLALQQIDLVTEQIRRMGDPGALGTVAGAAQTLSQLGRTGVAQSLRDIQTRTTGQSGMAYEGQGLYQPVAPDIAVVGGGTVARPQQAYRKYEALQQAVVDYDAVVADTQARRETLLAALRETAAQLQSATTDAEVQKLKGLLASQESALNNVAAERTEAAAKVTIQHAANEGDQMRQAQADLELRAASLQSALKDVARFFKVDSHPTLIPDPRTIAH